MAIKRFSYLDIPEEARREAGNRRLSQLTQKLSDRSATTEQRQLAQQEMALVNAWVEGTIEVPPAPKHHVIEVSESLSVEEM